MSRYMVWLILEPDDRIASVASNGFADASDESGGGVAIGEGESVGYFCSPFVVPANKYSHD